MKKTIKAWAMIYLDGSMALGTIAKTKRATIYAAMDHCRKWTTMYAHGYRIHRITITVED
jgi:hypothetical protein